MRGTNRSVLLPLPHLASACCKPDLFHTFHRRWPCRSGRPPFPRAAGFDHILNSRHGAGARWYLG